MRCTAWLIPLPRRSTNRLGFPDAGLPGDQRLRKEPHAMDGAADIGLPIAQITAQRDIRMVWHS